MSKSFKKVAEKNQRHKSVHNKEEHMYFAFSQELLCNKNDASIQDLFSRSADKEKKLKRLQELKRAKQMILEQETNHKFMQPNFVNDNYMDSFEKKQKDFEEELKRQKVRQ